MIKMTLYSLFYVAVIVSDCIVKILWWLKNHDLEKCGRKR